MENGTETLRERIARQLEIESESRALGASRYQSARPLPWRTATAKPDDEADLPPGRQLLKLAIEPTAQAIRDFVDRIANGGAGTKANAYEILSQIGPEEAAYLTGRVVVNAAASRLPLTKTAIAVADALIDHIEMAKLRERNRPGFQGLLKAQKRKSSSRRRRDQTRRIMEKEGAAIDAPLKRSWKRDAANVHEANAMALSKRLAMSQRLWIATKFSREDAIYFPHELDFRGRIYAEALAAELVKKYDQQVLAAIIKTARASAQFSGGYGGNSAVFTNSATDATALYNAILDCKVGMDNKEVDTDGTTLYSVLKPLQHSMLARSDKFINRDYNGGAGTVAKNSLTTVDGIQIIKSGYANGVYGANTVSDANTATYYQGNFTNTVATVFTMDAVATAEVQGVSTESEYQVSRQGTLMVARSMTGTRSLRPEAAAEIKSA